MFLSSAGCVLEPRPKPDQQKPVAGQQLGGARCVVARAALPAPAAPAPARANGAGTSGILERIRGVKCRVHRLSGEPRKALNRR